MTWQAWLTRARILAGLGLLMQGRRVSEVAAEVGYNSLSAFAKAFAMLTGKSPRDVYNHRTSACAGSRTDESARMAALLTALRRTPS